MIQIQWLGHACFKLTANNDSIVIDPYADGYIPGLDRIRTTANQVLCSHEHNDHGFREGVTVEPRKQDNPWQIRTLDSWHDDQEGTLRGNNKIHILECNGIRAVHFGDLGCMLTDEQLEVIGRPDVIMIPVGGFYTIDAETAKMTADRTGARIIIPMHYRSEQFGFDVLDTVDHFLEMYDDSIPVCRYDSDRIEISKNTQSQIVLFSQWNQG